MYEETACFDPNSIPESTMDTFSNLPPPPLMAGSTTNSPNSFDETLKLSMEELSAAVPTTGSTAGVMEVEFDQQLAFNFDQSNWEIHEMNFANQNNLNNPPDLLNLFRLPRSSNSSISFTSPAIDSSLPAASPVLYDPLFHLNLPPQPPLFRELFQSLPHGYNMPRTGSLFGGGGGDDGEGNGGVYHDGDERFENGILEFSRDMACLGKGRDGSNKHFATERQRRQHLNGKYTDLRNLVPNPSKIDRASIVSDAINYINELNRTVNELKILVEKKRCGRERIKRHKAHDDSSGAGTGEVVESINNKSVGDSDQSYNGSSLRSSWLQRKSKDAEVDVRIIDDEVTIKLVQRKKINCLLSVSKVLDELQLDLHHVAGGHIGDHYSYLFNTKIYEGSSVYASAIANKLIEVVDRH